MKSLFAKKYSAVSFAVPTFLLLMFATEQILYRSNWFINEEKYYLIAGVVGLILCALMFLSHRTIAIAARYNILFATFFYVPLITIILKIIFYGPMISRVTYSPVHNMLLTSLFLVGLVLLFYSSMVTLKKGAIVFYTFIGLNFSIVINHILR